MRVSRSDGALSCGVCGVFCGLWGSWAPAGFSVLCCSFVWRWVCVCWCLLFVFVCVRLRWALLFVVVVSFFSSLFGLARGGFSALLGSAFPPGVLRGVGGVACVVPSRTVLR